MFSRKPPKWQASVGKRSLFRGRTRDKSEILLPRETLKRTPVIRPAKKSRASPTANTQSHTRPTQRYRNGIAFVIANALLTCGIVLFWPAAMGIVEHSRNQIWGVDQSVVKSSLGPYIDQGTLPPMVPLAGLPGEKNHVIYTIDAELQAAIESELEKFRPDYGMVVAMDAESGNILAMADIRRDGQGIDNQNLKATYPAASVFKTITAAAAIDTGKAKADTVIPYNGKSTTLYKSNVLRHRNNKWTRHQTLAESFSKSVNTVFARLGIYTVGGDRLMEYSDRFLFNQPMNSDIPVQPSTLEMDPSEEWSVAETASGYTRTTSISPIHGALLAATIINDGVMPAPRLVDAITDEYGIILFESTPDDERVVKSETADEMRKLMNKTVTTGSASRQFRGFSKRFKDVEVGGKTGSLTGFQPKGKYDWFIGYATDGNRKLAYAVLCINKEFWYVKSTFLARKLVENYFSTSS